MNIVLLGPPGAGKGTQSKNLAKRLALPHISTGDLLRQNVAAGTELGAKAKDFMNKGLLVPDELVTQMLTKRFQDADVKSGFILDGYPRNFNQAKVLDEILTKMSLAIDLVIDLAASDSIIISRLSGRIVCRKCGNLYHKINMPSKVANICDSCGGELYQRADDKEETIKNRLVVYKEEVSALLEYYKKTNRLQTIPADDAAEVVLDKVVDLIKSKNK